MFLMKRCNNDDVMIIIKDNADDNGNSNYDNDNYDDDNDDDDDKGDD